MSRVRIRAHRQYNVKQLQERHHQILRLALLGHKNVEIAEVLNITPQNVSDVLSSPLAQEQLAMMRTVADVKAIDISRMLSTEAPKALQLISDIMAGKEISGERPNLKMRFEAAESLLDRQGTSKVQNIKAFVGHALVTDDILADVKRKAAEAKEAAMAAGNVIVLPIQEAVNG